VLRPAVDGGDRPRDRRVAQDLGAARAGGVGERVAERRCRLGARPGRTGVAHERKRRLDPRRRASGGAEHADDGRERAEGRMRGGALEAEAAADERGRRPPSRDAQDAVGADGVRPQQVLERDDRRARTVAERVREAGRQEDEVAGAEAPRRLGAVDAEPALAVRDEVKAAAPDAWTPRPHGARMTEWQEMVPALRGIRGALTGADVRRVFSDGDEACVLYELHTGPVPDAPVAAWYRGRDGRIAAIRAYFDARPFAPMFAGGGGA
jgi:hypothetical protein